MYIKSSDTASAKIYRYSGARYISASVLPVLVGATLPLWLDPPGFSERPLLVLEFLVITVLLHSGFSFLISGFEGTHDRKWTKSKLLITGASLLFVAILIGLHLNTSISLGKHVYKGIFLVYLGESLFAGLLFAVPPFSFVKRIGGEMFVSIGLGMMPVLGVYIVQVGDITRTVYLAAMPIVVSTALWVWISELITREDDEAAKNTRMVGLFPTLFAARYGTFALIIMLYSVLVLGVFGRSSLNPLALIALLTLVLAARILMIVWHFHSDQKKLQRALFYSAILHTLICIVIILSSMASL